MNCINEIILLGNLTTDPKLEYLDDGQAVGEISIAVNKKNDSSDSYNKENVQYFNVKIWNKLAENCTNYLKKGSRVMISGYLNIKNHENKEGKKTKFVNITAKVVAASLEFNSL